MSLQIVEYHLRGSTFINALRILATTSEQGGSNKNWQEIILNFINYHLAGDGDKAILDFTPEQLNYILSESDTLYSFCNLLATQDIKVESVNETMEEEGSDFNRHINVHIVRIKNGAESSENLCQTNMQQLELIGNAALVDQN